MRILAWLSDIRNPSTQVNSTICREKLKVIKIKFASNTTAGYVISEVMMS